VGNQNPDSKTPKYEKCCQTVKNTVERFRHDYSWVFSFSCGHRDIIWTSDSERGLNEALKESEKSPKISTIVQFRKCTRGFPIAEAKSIMKRITSQHCDECEDDEANDQENLSKSKPLE
jgi:hypothetical protein